MDFDFAYIARAIITNTVYQLVFTVGLIAAVGLVVGLLNRAFYSLVGYRFGRIVCMATGFIGVPVHEIGHAVFCIIFGHRIVEMKLYQPNSADGTLGYVNHSYNRRNVYHQIGNFFIGFGPILFGSAVLLAMMVGLVPSLFEAFRDGSDFSEVPNLDVISLSALGHIFEVMRGASLAFFSSSDIGDWRWWLFMVPACSIALHMSLSVPDIKSSWVGFGFILLTLLLVNIVLFFVRIDMMLALTNHCLVVGTFILNFLTISVVFSLILFLFGLVVMLITRLRPR